MRKTLMQGGAIGFALGVLGLLMVQASGGCSTTKAEPEAPPPQAAEPPITTKAAEPPAQPAPTVAATPEPEPKPEPEPAAAPPPAKKAPPRYMPATKAGPMFYEPNAPPQKQGKE